MEYFLNEFKKPDWHFNADLYSAIDLNIPNLIGDEGSHMLSYEKSKDGS